MNELILNRAHYERVIVEVLAKVVIVDGRLAYVGSANMTGAGIGAKSVHKRNFEAGFLTDDRGAIGTLMAELDRLYLGQHCGKCGRREYCPDPIA